MRPSLSQLSRALIMTLPVVVMLVWSSRQAFCVVDAVLTFDVPVPQKHNDLDPMGQAKLRRSIQRHFSDHGIYIPLDDILIGNKTDEQNPRVRGAMQKRCDRARLHVWVPFRFKFPIIGEKVVEWCWKPQTRSAQI